MRGGEHVQGHHMAGQDPWGGGRAVMWGGTLGQWAYRGEACEGIEIGAVWRFGLLLLARFVGRLP